MDCVVFGFGELKVLLIQRVFDHSNASGRFRVAGARMKLLF